MCTHTHTIAIEKEKGTSAGTVTAGTVLVAMAGTTATVVVVATVMTVSLLGTTVVMTHYGSNNADGNGGDDSINAYV